MIVVLEVAVFLFAVECCSEDGSRCCVPWSISRFFLVIIRLEIMNHRGKGLKIKHTNQGSQC